MFNSLKKIIVASLILSLASLAAFAAENNTPEATEVDEQAPPQAINTDREIEQINVVGQRTLMSMRHQIIREEDSLHRMFNDLNEGDKFDIYCKTEANTYSYIAQRSCDPVFFSELKQANARYMVSETRQAFSEDGINFALLQNGLDLAESDEDLRAQAEGDFEAMNEEMLRIALENPEYLAILQKIAELKSEYKAAQVQFFGKD